MQEVYDFLRAAGIYYLATAEGKQPRVRPFNTCVMYDDRIYIQTGKEKDVSKQMEANPNIEICAYKDGHWLRISAEAHCDDSITAKQFVLDQYPMLKERYAADDDSINILYLENVTATFASPEGIYRMMKF